MKLAEALLLKKTLASHIVELQQRYKASAVIEDGEMPEENLDLLMSKLEDAFAEHEKLCVNINLTNNVVKVGDRTMMAALAHRDALKVHAAAYKFIAESMRQKNEIRRHYGSESPKMKIADGALPISLLQSKVDAVSKELRELDVLIQGTNWTSDLIDGNLA